MGNLEKKINKIIKKINPGRKIEVDKICPLINDRCIGLHCNAFVQHSNINVVNQDEIDKYIDAGNISWEKDLIDNDWKLHTIITTPKITTPDEHTHIYTKSIQFNNYLEDFASKIGRCLMGGK